MWFAVGLDYSQLQPKEPGGLFDFGGLADIQIGMMCQMCSRFVVGGDQVTNDVMICKLPTRTLVSIYLASIWSCSFAGLVHHLGRDVQFCASKWHSPVKLIRPWGRTLHYQRRN